MTLISEWYPVTEELGLVDAPVEAVVDTYDAWNREHGTTQHRRMVDTSLADAFAALPPLSMELRRTVFVATRVGWTAFFRSGITGSDPTSSMSQLAKRLRVVAMSVGITPPSATLPAVRWFVFAPPALGGDALLYERRVVYAINEGGRWAFYQKGEPYPFEQSERYDARRKRDRFPPQLLIQYLAALGLAPFEEAFYVVTPSQPAVLLESEKRWPEPPPEFTLAEVIGRRPSSRDR